MNRYISVNVLSDRGGYDCSMWGASTRDDAYHLLPHPDGNFDQEDINRWNEDGTAYVLWEVNTVSYRNKETINVRPNIIPEGKHSMFGGNYLISSDSRFRSVSNYPVPCHDRVEG
jgi:hypothetical protein